MIGYWNRMLSSKGEKYTKKIYKHMMHDNNNYKWITKVKEILNNTGNSQYWLLQDHLTPKSINKKVKRSLLDQNIQRWNDAMSLSSKGQFYRTIKQNIEFEKYLKILQFSQALPIYKLRTANHYFPIETGRWNGTAMTNRLCTLCNRNEIGNEKHYLFHCELFSYERTKFTTSISCTPVLLSQIFNLTSFPNLRLFSQFASVLVKRVTR